MKGMYTLDGVSSAEFPSSQSNALAFLAEYPWRRISEIDHHHVVVEEIGRNTGRVFGFRYEGTPDEIRPLLRFLYVFQALQAACFCTCSPDWREKVVSETVEKLRRFPKDASVPLAVACSCIKKKEFEDLAQVFSKHVPIVTNPILLEPGILPDYHWSVLPIFGAEIAMMLTSGISAREDIVAGIHAASHWKKKKGPKDLLAAAELSRDGLCSFVEALAL